MPCFVIHWHAYFPTGLFYLLPGPCLPCSKFDVSGYQFIPTWNKEKFTVRNKQHHTQKHHQNATFEHTSSTHIRLMFSYAYSTFLCKQFASISHGSPVFLIVHQYFSSVSSTGIACATGPMQRTMSSVFTHWNLAVVCRQRGTSLGSSSAQHDLPLENLPCWGWHKVWAPLVLLPTAPGGVCPPGLLWGGVAALEQVVCYPSSSANHPDVTASLQVLILQGGQQDLSFLPESHLQ